jgi:hypothetical protein
MPSRTLSDDSYGIDLCDEAPASVWASDAGFIRRPNRHGVRGSVISPNNRATVQPLSERGGGVGRVEFARGDPLPSFV